MRTSVVTIEPNGHLCSDCAVRGFTVWFVAGPAELREFEHLGRRVHFATGATVFSEKDIMTSFYNLLEGVGTSPPHACCVPARSKVWARF